MKNPGSTNGFEHVKGYGGSDAGKPGVCSEHVIMCNSYIHLYTDTYISNIHVVCDILLHKLCCLLHISWTPLGKKSEDARSSGRRCHSHPPGGHGRPTRTIPSWQLNKQLLKITILMGKLTFSMAIFNSYYDKLREGTSIFA